MVAICRLIRLPKRLRGDRPAVVAVGHPAARFRRTRDEVVVAIAIHIDQAGNPVSARGLGAATPDGLVGEDRPGRSLRFTVGTAQQKQREPRYEQEQFGTSHLVFIPSHGATLAFRPSRGTAITMTIVRLARPHSLDTGDGRSRRARDRHQINDQAELAPQASCRAWCGEGDSNPQGIAPTSTSS